jgi:hypothetical protein
VFLQKKKIGLSALGDLKKFIQSIGGDKFVHYEAPSAVMHSTNFKVKLSGDTNEGGKLGTCSVLDVASVVCSADALQCMRLISMCALGGSQFEV